MTNVVSLPPPEYYRHTRWELNAGNVPVNHTGHPAQVPPQREKMVKLCPRKQDGLEGHSICIFQCTIAYQIRDLR